jgi:hypothetical protein
MMNQIPEGKGSNPAYSSIYKLAAWAAWSVGLLTAAEVVAFVIFPQPDTITGWFELFQENPVVGLVDFWGLELPMYMMFALVFLALYFALREGNESLTTVALILALLGIAIFFAANNPFSMLSLSNKYAAATTDAQSSALLAAGEAILANTNQRAVDGFNIGLFLVSIAGLIVSYVMLSSSSFRRSTARIGILAFGLSLADYLRQVLTSSDLIALSVILPGAILLITWHVMVGRRLLQLGRLEA